MDGRIIAGYTIGFLEEMRYQQRRAIAGLGLRDGQYVLSWWRREFSRLDTHNDPFAEVLAGSIATLEAHLNEGRAEQVDVERIECWMAGPRQPPAVWYNGWSYLRPLGVGIPD